MLERESSDPNFWDDSDKAQAQMRTLNTLRAEIDLWDDISTGTADSLELAELDDDELRPDIESELERILALVDRQEFLTLFSGKFDQSDAYFAIHAGAGGTEAQDWADMLRRMFIRWMEAKKYKVDILDFQPGDITGTKRILIKVQGDYAFGHLRSERGVHRLVRISPYDSSSRRHTSFAKVEVWPDIEEDIEIEINDKDLRIDRFKASGAGGQHLQKNETAIRITHEPTGIVVASQHQRSLTQNLETAMKFLKTQLFELEQAKQEAAIAEVKGEDVDAGWGSQIRSYVLHPYKMVKDHRTNFESSNPNAVLDGKLDAFIEAYLRGDGD